VTSKPDAKNIGCDYAQSGGGGRLYERLERAIIALEYALADARRPNGPSQDEQISSLARSQQALQSAGEEVQDVLQALKMAALSEAAARVKRWG
jgi:hypothetical protein